MLFRLQFIHTSHTSHTKWSHFQFEKQVQVMGVSNHSTGEWTGMVEWIMELTISLHSVRPQKGLFYHGYIRVQCWINQLRGPLCMCVFNGKLTLNSRLGYGISHCVLVLFLSVRPQKNFLLQVRLPTMYQMPLLKLIEYSCDLWPFRLWGGLFRS